MNRAARDVERHRFGPGFVAALAGVFLAFWGLSRLTDVHTVAGPAASEIQLMKAFSSGGLKYASRVTPPPPPKLTDAAAEAEAMDRWAQQQANAASPSWKIRVDTTAQTPCPT